MSKDAFVPTTVMWFRRDLRLRDNPALVAAAKAGSGSVAGLFILDEQLLAKSGQARIGFMAEAISNLDASMSTKLNVLSGKPVETVVEFAREVGATKVFVTEEFTPYAIERDQKAAEALKKIGVELVQIDSPYVVKPGTIMNQAGLPYKVFGGFRRGWEPLSEGIKVLAAPKVEWVQLSTKKPVIAANSRIRPRYFGDCPESTPDSLPEASEVAAKKLIAEFAKKSHEYADHRNEPGVSGTSRLSPYLRFGLVHPRQILAEISQNDAGGRTFASEICWREFYADVLFTNPNSRYEALQPKMARLRIDSDATAIQRFQTWTQGQTGYPLVDAGMRQLLAEGWMHNRVRMVTASFLIKNLHIDWRWGAQWFMCNLIDGDIASNQHGWQWTAGTGTDAAPFHRIFNPTLQAERFDPDGEYIKRYVPELREVPAPDCLRPQGGTLLSALDYPPPIVDHGVERAEALARLAELETEAES